MGFFYIIHDIQLTHIFEVLIHRLHQVVNELQVRHLVLLLQVHPDDEVQRCVSSVDHLVHSVFDE